MYVRPFPDVEAGRWQVSVQGGFSPHWSPDGREIFFSDANRTMVAVEVDGTSELSYGAPETLFTLDNDIEFLDIALVYDVAPDGRFVMARTSVGSEEDGGQPEVILVNNFFEELEARAGS